MQEIQAIPRSTRTATQRTRVATLTAQHVEQPLTTAEGALLLGAFLTLAASMASFITL